MSTVLIFKGVKMNVIEVKHLTKDYGHGRGVFDVSIEVKEGEVFGFLGPNGAGKSTTIRHLMGFSAPDSGSVTIFDKETFNKYDEILDKVGYIPGEIALPQGLTGYEFLDMIKNMRHEKKAILFTELLSLFKVDDTMLKTDTKRMSLGEKRKLAIVAAFMNDPDVLILDEPTSGLDPVMQNVFIDYILKEKTRGKTILLSSHIFSEIDATCDRIAIIKDGKVVSTFVADELKHAKRKYYNIVFSKDEEKEAFLSQINEIPSFILLNKSEKEIMMSIEDSDLNMVVRLLSKYRIVLFSNHKESLQDYFMKFYKEEKDFKGAL